MWDTSLETLSHFQRPWLLAGLLVVPLLGVLAWRADVWRRRALIEFGHGKQMPELERARRSGRFWSRLAFQTGLTLLLVAAAGPQWGKDWEASIAPGRDLILVLDVSRSMTAEQPTRLELARRALDDLLTTIRQRGGHRIAVVLFAGRPRIVCPLTQDYDHVADVLTQVEELRLDPELSPGPREASGTRIGFGLVEGLRARDKRSAGVTDLLLISDGDDPSGDSDAEFGIIEARGAEVPISVVGVGDAKQESTIPGPDGPLKDGAGRLVRTRLEEKPLEEIARETGGKYIGAGRSPVALGTIYREAIATLPRRTESLDRLPALQSRYRLFLVPALALLVLGLARRE